ncbi:MAG: CBS domain-containing protein [Limnothrix sp.]
MITKTVAEIMTTAPITVTAETPLREAIQTIAEKHVSSLPVVDQKGRIVGIISKGDLTWQETGVDTPPYFMLLDSIIYLQNPAKHDAEIHKALGQTVGEVMSKRVYTIGPDQSVREAAHEMHDKRVGRLPVVDPETDKVLGVITQGDIIRTMAQVS